LGQASAAEKYGYPYGYPMANEAVDRVPAVVTVDAAVQHFGRPNRRATARLQLAV